MQVQSYRVKMAIAHCDAWYTTRDFNIRTLTERVNALWLEVEHLLCLMEQAEQANDRKAAADALERVIGYVTRIQAEVKGQRDRY